MIEAHITEYQMHHVVCGGGGTTQAPLPPQVQGHFGPRLTAAIAYMTVICHVTRRPLQCLLEQVLQAFSLVWGPRKMPGKKPVRRWPNPIGHTTSFLTMAREI